MLKKRLKTRLTGKIDSYLINAYHDAAISRHLLAFITDGQTPPHTETGQRAQRLIDQTPADKKDERLAVQAFAQYWLNGHADYAYARLHRLALPSRSLPRPNPYAERETGRLRLTYPWADIALGRYQALHEFVFQKTKRRLTLGRKEIATEIIRVQQENGRYNRTVRKMLKKRLPCSPKATGLTRQAQEVPWPHLYLRAAERAQAGAAVWDKLFSAAVKITGRR